MSYIRTRRGWGDISNAGAAQIIEEEAKSISPPDKDSGSSSGLSGLGIAAVAGLALLGYLAYTHRKKK